MSAGVALPRAVFGHGFMTHNGQRMSKTLGTVIDPSEAVSRFGPDPLRLYVTKEITFGSDGDFSWERYDERYNVDLANNLGNLVSRVTAMAHRYCQGRLMPSRVGSGPLAGLGEEVAADYRRAMDALAPHEAVAAVYSLVDATNEFLASTAPWSLAKDPASADRLAQVLFDSAEAIRLVGVLLTPVMPASSAEILRRVGVSAEQLRLDRDGRWRAEGERLLEQKAALWPRHEVTEKPVMPMKKERVVTDVPTPPQPIPSPVSGTDSAPGSSSGPRISIDEFMKVELRVAKVLSAERVPKSRKLLKLLVDVGTEQRTLVAGIADGYEPETLVGRSVAIVFNLQPATLMGIESNGMVLAASPDGGKPTLVSFENPPPPGTRVR
jgi:methionyl-tRNA synthetase